jgi:phospholipid/cholesterol/gamma-HCH transport system substrate-binding protein
MAIKKEIKVGLLGVITLTILYLGFNFLKGLDLFSSEIEYTVYYNDVQGLQASNPVTYNGVNVGRVMNIETDMEKNNVKVTLTINKRISVTDKSIALLGDDGLIGGKLVKLKINPGKTLADGGILIGAAEVGLLQSTTEKLEPTLKNVDSLVTTLTQVVSQFDQTGTALKVLVASATQTTNGVNGVVAANSKNLGEITANAAVLTANLNALSKNLDSQLKPILQKTNTFADSLQAVRLGNTVHKLNATVTDLQGILNGINSGKGTLGKLTGDDSLYVNLDRTAASLNLLLSDMKAHPKRYVHFSLFGKKDKPKEGEK